MGDKSNMSDLSWTEKKGRIDDMLDKLKNELKEVKNTDKDLTRQFINLGGKINELKTRRLEDEIDELDDEEMINGDDVVFNEHI